MCPRRRSKPAPHAEGPKILLEFLSAIVDGNVALRQQMLKFAVAHLSETARLCQSQPLLLKQRQGELPLQFRFSDLSRRKDIVWNRQGHSRCFYYSVTAVSCGVA